MIAGQLALDKDDGRLIHNFHFDTDVLKAGYNALIFQTAASLGMNCESSKTPQVWSEINLQKTELIVTYRRKDVRLTLADLKSLLFPGIGGTSMLNVITAGLDEGTLKATGLAVQGVAVQQRFTIPEYKHYDVAEWMGMASVPVVEEAVTEAETASEATSEDGAVAVEGAPTKLVTPPIIGASIFNNI
jgi:hypothetical protein